MADAPDGGLGDSMDGANKGAETLKQKFANIKNVIQDVASNRRYFRSSDRGSCR